MSADRWLLKPVVSGLRAEVRSVRPSDFHDIADLLSDGDVAPTWRLRGSWGSADNVVESLLGDAGIAAVFRHKKTRSLAGVASLYSMNFQSGHCFLAFAAHREQMGTAGEGLLLFLRSGFEISGVRKIYAEIPAFNMTSYQSALRHAFTCEVTIPGRDLHQGESLDVHILSTTLEAILAANRPYWTLLEQRDG
jgi:RimJ/RimL family protein N-acetyltransferase